MQDFEKLGAFYLGRPMDAEGDAPVEAPLLYDARDLTTHAVCVGMTGSGKTGLCLSLLEEAALDGIPAIAIDPKGDLGNLLLTFPNLEPAEFEPWIDEGEARRKGVDVPTRAAQVAELWRTGLAKWGQGPERIARFREAVDLPIYTPGSSAGLPLSVLQSFSAPKDPTDADTVRERISASVSGLLGLVGADADPLQSPEHILLSTLVQHAWSEGRDLGLADLIRGLTAPPFDRVGVMDLDDFIPPKKRNALAMRLNGLLASPGFAPWLEGEPLDIQRLLYTDAGKPRLCILSIAHLGDAERMFFVTLLLSELVSWMRSQPGTSSLRALLYMDEVFGFLPPVANPPSKTPMLTLLKQARAFGVGVVLATQNPVDVDYKALSNCGTWFLGRLQTERDVDRVMDGLTGAASAAGQPLDGGEIRRTLGGLGSRIFLMNNVHEDAPVLFHTRWALSYLRGPLTRGQISDLMEERKAQQTDAPAPMGAAPAPASDHERPSLVPTPKAQQTAPNAQAPAAPVAAAEPAPPEASAEAPTPRPMIPEHVEELFLGQPAGAFHYQPGFLATCRLHYSHTHAGVDTWTEPTLLVPVQEEIPTMWDDAPVYDFATLTTAADPAEAAGYLEIPRGMLGKGKLRSVGAALKRTLYAEHTFRIGYCRELRMYSRLGEQRSEFAARVAMKYRESRDEDVDKVRERYGKKLDKLKEKRRKAQQKVERERAQVSQRKMDSAVSVGTSVLGALFGRKSTRSVGTAARSVSRVAKERGDVERALDDVASVQGELEDLEEEMTDAVAELHRQHDEPPAIEELVLHPKKTDISVVRLVLAWVPIAP